MFGFVARSAAVVGIVGVVTFALPVAEAQAFVAPPAPTIWGAVRAAAPLAGEAVVACAATIACPVALGVAAVGIGLYATKDTWMPWASDKLGLGGGATLPGPGGTWGAEWTLDLPVVDPLGGGVFSVTGVHIGPGGSNFFSDNVNYQCMSTAGVLTMNSGVAFTSPIAPVGASHTFTAQCPAGGKLQYLQTVGGTYPTSNQVSWGIPYDPRGSGAAYTVTVKCQKPDGSTADISVTATSVGGEGLPLPSCEAHGMPVGSHGICVTVTGGRVGLPAGTLSTGCLASDTSVQTVGGAALGTATAQNTYGGESAGKSIDGSAGTSWMGGGPRPAWWQVQLPSARRFISVSMTRYDPEPGRMATGFTVAGSNDGATFTTLGTFTAGWQYAAAGVTQTFPFTNGATFTYYRINVTANTDAEGYPRVGEVTFGTASLYEGCLGAGQSCVYDVMLDGAPCTVGGVGCVDWTRYVLSEPGRYQCRFGTVIVDMKACAFLERSYELHPIQATGPNTDGDPSTHDTTMPDGTIDPKPQTPPRAVGAPLPQPGTTPSTEPLPGAPGGAPLPLPGFQPVPQPTQDTNEDCWASGASWNPVDWVLTPVKCSLVWAFVPRTAIQTQLITDQLDRAGVAPSVAALSTAVGSLGGSEGGCEGPAVNFDIETVHQVIHPFAACTAPMSTVAGYAYAFISVVVVIGGAGKIISLLGHAFGYGAPAPTWQQGTLF